MLIARVRSGPLSDKYMCVCVYRVCCELYRQYPVGGTGNFSDTGSLIGVQQPRHYFRVPLNFGTDRDATIPADNFHTRFDCSAYRWKNLSLKCFIRIFH